ncbi:MAG TPA: hypothetical protein EYP43_02285, partial [Thermoplasmata archaeon]|nr:hypothetical protein [Thermoplasmata archaeon]
LRNDGWANYGSSITISLQVEDSSGSTVVTDSYTHSGGLDVDEWTWVYFNWSHVSTSGLETYNVTVSVDMSNDQDSIDDALTTQVKRYWIKWWEDFETGDFDAPNPAMNGSWWVSDPLGDNGGGYYDGGAGLNTDPQYTYPYGSTDPYEGRYCAIERLSRYESIYDVSAYVAFNMSGWDNVGISFYYDTYVSSYYLYYNYYHAEVLVSDDNGSSWTLLGELNKDTTVNNWQAVSFDISGNPNVDMTSNVTIRFRFYTTNFYAYATYYFKWDAIAMTGDPYDKDIAVRALEIPGTSIRLSETIDITATVKNVGKDTINNVPVRCVVTDAQGSEEVNTTETISTLESLWSRDVTWSFTPTDVTRYYINVSVDVSGDEVPYNDEMSAWFDSLPLVFMETFEDGDTNATNNGIPADEGWYIPYPYGDQSGYYDAGAGLNTENTYAWNKNAYEGTYCGMESVSRYDSNDVWMDVSFLDTDYRSPLTISFMWDTYGSGSYYEAWVKVSYDGGDTWTELNDGYSFTMDYTYDNWQLHEEQLPDFTTTPDNITVRFEFKTASSYPYGSPYYWFKFDNIAIRFPLENDLAATGLDVPSIAGAGEVIPIDVTVKNKGYKNQTGFDVYVYVYNENGSLYGTYSETVSQTLAAGEEMSVTVDTGPIVFSSGKRNFKVRADVDLSGDQDLTNNKIGPVDMTVAWLAFFDTFESGDLVAPGAIWGWNISDPIIPGSYYDSGGGLNTQRYGNYPSGSTDAYQGTYCGIEYFGYDYSARTITMDVNIWVNEWEDLELSFWYDTYAYSYYSYRFHFEIYAYNGSAWIRLNGDSELPKDMSVNNWALYSENLSANSYFDWSSLENFTLRFQARKDYGYSYYGYNYFKFDNIMLSGAPPANDAAVVAVDLSRRKVTAGQDIDITATVKNAGGDFQSSIQVRLEIYDQWGTLKESDYTKYATDLDPGETATKSYTWTTDDKPSTYTVVIEVVLSGDSNPWNDEMQATFETGLFVFYDDFEDGDTDVTNNELPADEGWEISRRIPPNAMGSGAGVTSSNDHYYSSHGSAYNGHYCMIMQLDYYTREVTVNFTLDMSSYRGAKIQFWYDTFLYYYYASTHFIEVMVNNNSGSGWVTISEDSDFVKDYTANNWNLYKDTIDGDYMTDELTVQIRYRTTGYSSYYYYFKFDDIMLTFLPRHDLSVISVEAPPQANPGEWITVNATVTNEGWETKSNFDVVFEAIYDSNGTVADRQTVTVPDSIAMFETTYVEFQFRSEIWEKTEYTLIVYTALPTDQDDSNNASSIPFVGVWTLFWEDYEGEEKLVASGRFVTGGWWINEPLGDQSYY